MNERIYEEGMEAYFNGLEMEDCPYDGHSMNIWKQGWMYAYVESK